MQLPGAKNVIDKTTEDKNQNGEVKIRKVVRKKN